MDGQHWREKLSKLDLVRECSAPTSADCCWLCDDLESWNCVLNAFHLDLTQFQVGKLQLGTLPGDGSSDVEERDIPYNAHFFVVWLPKKHSCVETITITEDPHFHITEVPDSISQCASNLRHISIVGIPSFECAWLLDALSPIQQLEVIELRDVVVSDCLASQLAYTLSANPVSVRRINVSKATIECSTFDILMRGISKCERLKELMFKANLNPAGLRNFTKWLKSAKTLEILHLEEELQSDDSTMEFDPERNSEEIWCTIGSLLRENGSLSELRCQAYTRGCAEFLRALKTNCTLKSLTIVSSIYDRMYIDCLIGAVLNSVLSTNQALRSLSFEGCHIDSSAVELISEGLQQNTTLEFLDVSQSCAGPRVRHLINVLGLNSSLRSLNIDFSEAPPTERRALSMEVARNRWHGRVLVPWSDVDVEGLVASVSDLSLCPAELHLRAGLLSEASLSALCSALASGGCVRDLVVYLKDATISQVKTLHQMLQENKSLRSLTLYDCDTQPGLSVMASQGLIMNEFVTDLAIVCHEMSTMSAELLGLLLETNESLHKLVLKCDSRLEPQCLDPILEGLIQNNFIIEADVGCTNPLVRAAVKRNVLCLHRAARFVLRRNVGKCCAEAFELLESKASLISCLKSTSGMTEAEAKAAVGAAQNFLQSNYLFINRIVAHKVECYAGNGTQIDRLNFECWLAIAKYLRVSDVIQT